MNTTWINNCKGCSRKTSGEFCIPCMLKSYVPIPLPIREQLSTFELKRVEFLISQADKGTAVYLGKGDSEILKKLLEVVDKEE